MTALDRLTALLRQSLKATERPFPVSNDIEMVIASLQKHTKEGTNKTVPEDLLQAAVQRFWESPKFDNLKEARLVSFGMCLPSRPSGSCIMEDRQRFLAVLDSKGGVDQWLAEPRCFRRCYQGLVHSYFVYDACADQARAAGRRNWGDLRDYLNERAPNIFDKKANPDWVVAALENRQLFGDDPCAPYAEDLLSGDSSRIDQLCEQLAVVKSSWFLRELVLAQLRQSTRLSHERFVVLIPQLLDLLANNLVLRDRGLVLMLDKYALESQPNLNEPLRNASVDWWGNPWLPSNEMRWGGVAPAAREMVSEWLKREFIEAFFTKLAEDGVGDRRRANFWLRYVKSMDKIQFALGSRALYSRDRDFVALRKKMKGLYTELRTSGSANNAFIMTLGDLVAVEFGDGGAFYGYDERQQLPFDASRPVGTSVDAPNSLKHRSRILWMKHQDGIHGWSRWEDMFEGTLKEHLNIHPNAMTRHDASISPAQSPAESVPGMNKSVSRRSSSTNHASGKPNAVVASSPDEGRRIKRSYGNFSKAGLHDFTQLYGLKVEDLKNRNGNLWVRADDSDPQINKVMLSWGFSYKSGKGWWR
jgi:hypothetical protein